jgi:uncharacterized protein (DUF302 family)
VARPEGALKARGATLLGRIDHAAAAGKAGLTLAPTVLLIFGNACGGTPLMHERPTIGIDLPLKALVWQNGAGSAWLSYNELSWPAARHANGAGARSALDAMSAAMQAIASEAACFANRASDRWLDSSAGSAA